MLIARLNFGGPIKKIKLIFDSIASGCSITCRARCNGKKLLSTPMVYDVRKSCSILFIEFLATDKKDSTFPAYMVKSNNPTALPVRVAILRAFFVECGRSGLSQDSKPIAYIRPQEIPESAPPLGTCVSNTNDVASTEIMTTRSHVEGPNGFKSPYLSALKVGRRKKAE